jgi:hypothetical protein
MDKAELIIITMLFWGLIIYLARNSDEVAFLKKTIIGIVKGLEFLFWIFIALLMGGGIFILIPILFKKCN